MKSNSTEKPETFWNKFKSFILETDIRVLNFTSAVVVFIIIVAWAFLSSKVLRLDDPFPYTSIILGLTFIFISFVGIIQVYRREVPGPLGQPTKGVYAIISGILFILFFGAGGLWALIIGFQSLFSK